MEKCNFSLGETHVCIWVLPRCGVGRTASTSSTVIVYYSTVTVIRVPTPTPMRSTYTTTSINTSTAPNTFKN